MIYFDKKYLDQYLQTGEQVQVLVDGQYLDITHTSDIADPTTAVGYDTYGKPFNFTYKTISAVKFGENIFTLDALNQKFNPEQPAEKPAEENPKDDKAGEITIDPDKDSKDKKESLKLGDRIINDDISSQYFRSSGTILFIDESVVIYKTYIDGIASKVSCLINHCTKG